MVLPNWKPLKSAVPATSNTAELQLVVAPYVYSVDFEVWSKLAKHARIKRIASTFVRAFECALQRVKRVFPIALPWVPDTRSTLANISYSDTKVSVLAVMECKRANVIYVYELTFYFILSIQDQQSIEGFASHRGRGGWIQHCNNFGCIHSYLLPTTLFPFFLFFLYLDKKKKKKSRC